MVGKEERGEVASEEEEEEEEEGSAGGRVESCREW